MATMARNDKAVTTLPPRDLKRTGIGIAVWGVVLMLLMASWEGADMRPLALIRDGANMGQFMSGFFPPDFHEWPTFLSEMWVTIQIAIWGTALAILCAI